jgi:hypothetical protein
MFLRWQGDNFIDGPQRAGANILLSILFRPAITLLAFCSTLTIWPMVINFFNATWSVGFVAQQGGHVVGLTGWIVGLGWGGLISYHLGLRVMGLTARTFDSIAGVWGGQPAGGGEHEQSHTVLGVATQQRAGVGRAMEAIKPNAPKKPDDKKPKDETEK